MSRIGRLPVDIPNGVQVDVNGFDIHVKGPKGELTRQFPPTPTNGDNLRRAVEVSQAIREAARDPLPMMVLVSQAVEASPNVVLRDFGWRYGLTEIEKGAETSAVVPAAPAPGAPAPQRRQSAYVTGEIRPFRGDYRAAIDTINGIAARLRAHPSVAEVKTTKMPLNVSPKAVLSGNTLDSRAESGTAEFEFIIVLKPKV